jgi:DNA polymerase-3 subunit delta'
MFSKIKSQSKPKAVLRAQLKSGKIPHAYIFIGSSGIGKKLTAVELAKIINCQVNDFTKSEAGACGKCLPCQKIEKGIYPDLHIIDFAKQAEILEEEPEKQKEIRIKTIRHMQQIAATKPQEGKWKIFIIDPAEKMNINAANCLLKTLEEPPPNTILILIAMHKETLPQTIVSRAQVLFFEPAKETDIAMHLMATAALGAAEAEKIAASAEGSFETALHLAQNKDAQNSDLWLKLKNQNLAACDILDLSRTHAKNAAETIDLLILEAKKEFHLFGQKASGKLETLLNYKALLSKNVNAQTVLDNLFLELTEN